VRANKEMLLLPAEHSAPGSVEECHGAIAFAMTCDLERLMLDAGVVITPRIARGKSDRLCIGIITQCGGGQFCFYLPTAGCRMNLVFAMRHNQSNSGIFISAPTNLSLAAGRTRCSLIEIVIQTHMLSEMHHSASLVVQTGSMSKGIQCVGSSMWGSQFIVILIAVTHLLVFSLLIMAIITPRLVPLSAIFNGVSRTASSAAVLIVIAAAAAM